jgi:hypothetical protein
LPLWRPMPEAFIEFVSVLCASIEVFYINI